MKLKIKNFQNINEAEIDFKPGICVIQGESNNGKTAILRAVKAIITNPTGAGHFVQHGKKSATVELSNNGETLLWERTKSSVNYTYNGQNYTKASKQTSDDFCNLGFVKGQKGELLNLTDEWSVLFPFGYTDTELFKLFEDLFSITDSAKVLEGMKGDETSCNRDKLLQTDKLEMLKNKLGQCNELKSKFKSGQAEVIRKVISKKSEDLEKLKEKLKSARDYDTISNFEIPSKPFNSDELLKIGKQLLELFKACSQASQLPVNAKLPETKNFVFNLDVLGKLKKAELDYITEQKKRESLVINQEELEKVLADCKAKWESLKVCPLCGNEMNK